MEKVIANDITKYLVILGAGAIGLMVLLANIISSVKGAFKPYQKSTLWYLFLAILLFAVPSLLAYPTLFDNAANALIFFEAIFLLLGCLHTYLMPRKLEWTGEEKSVAAEVVFTILLAAIGAVVFLIIYHLLNKSGLEYVMAGSLLFFVVPFLVYQTFQGATSIPPKILKEWFYPLRDEMEEPEESKMKNLLVISFEFQKQATDQRITNFRAKAPVDMEMGQLFYYFINDYNERHPNSKVQYVNGKGDPYGWIFYKKPKWYSVMTSYIDAEKTIYNNKIKENDVIICSRSFS